MTTTQTQTAPVVGYASASTPRLEQDPILPPEHDRKLVLRWFLGVASILLIAYLLLQNPYWVPGGDSDFYVAIARNLAQGEGYTYNGLPVAISPPGWPWVMAAILKVSPTFLALKLFTMLCMWASLLIAYFIALRFVPPRLAALSVLLAGVLMPVYSLTYFLHSEGLYCVLSSLALLIAFRVREKPDRYLEATALLGLCVAIPFVRWAGVFQLLPIVGVLMSGAWGTWKNRRWILAGLCAVAIIVTWLGTRASLELSVEQLQAIKDAGGTAVMEIDAPEDLPTDNRPVAIPTATSKDETLAEEYSQRFLRSGKWFAWLLWQPSRFATALGKWDMLITASGWVLIALLIWLATATARRGHLMWVALGVYCGALCMNWPNPNARYFVPVAPQIVLGLLLVTRLLHDRYPMQSIDVWKWIRRAFVYSVLLVNVLLYGVDLMVMRSSNFYDTFEAGQHKDLINISYYLQSLPQAPAPTLIPGTTQPTTRPAGQWKPENGQIMINERYENLGRVRLSKAGMRAMVLLTDVDTKPLDPGWSKTTKPPFSGKMLGYMRSRRSDWLLVQTPAIPWRVWHFRLPMSIHERLTKYPGLPESGGWFLYHRQDLVLTSQPVPPAPDDWPTRVPGM